VRQLWKLLIALLVIAGGAFAFWHFAPPGTGPYAGTWKVTILEPKVEKALFILRVGGDENRPTAEVVDAPGFASARIEDVRVQDGALRLNLKTERGTFHIAGYAPAGQALPDRLLGSNHQHGFYDMVSLDRTSQREIEPGKGVVPTPGSADLERALGARSAAEIEKGVEDVLSRYADRPIAQFALLALVQVQANAGAPVEKVRATCERFLAGAAAYGREIVLQSTAQLARVLTLVPGSRLGALATEYAEQAEKLLTDADPPELAIGILQTQAGVLRAAGKNAEANERDERAAALNTKLDAEFAKNSLTFQPAPPAARRSGTRVVLVELFTGAQCPPCVGADIAFDAALQVYNPSQAVFLQYHEHVPGPDPLTCPPGEQRLRFYSEVPGTPAFIIDGKFLDQPVGGPADRGALSYDILHAALDQAMAVPAEAALKLAVRRDGDTVELSAEVSDLRRPSERTRLYFVLVEDVIRYAARNGQRLHHHVVRDFPGGVSGIGLPESSARRAAKVNLRELHKSLEEYLALANSRMPFPDAVRPLALEHLKAVAFIQHEPTKHVLQAAQVDVPDAIAVPAAEEKKGGRP
jgi:hypothetical protein